MKIPELFLGVIKKLHPEIETINPIKFFILKQYDNDFRETEGFIVHVGIVIGRGHSPSGLSRDYEEKLNTSFLYTYPDISFIKFMVDRVDFTRELTRGEIFSSLFEPVKEDLWHRT